METRRSLRTKKQDGDEKKSKLKGKEAKEAKEVKEVKEAKKDGPNVSSTTSGQKKGAPVKGKGNEKDDKKKSSEPVSKGINVNRKKVQEVETNKNKNATKSRIVLRRQTNNNDVVNLSECDEKGVELKNKNNNKTVDKPVKGNKVEDGGNTKADVGTDSTYLNKNANNNVKENPTIINRSIKRRLSQLLDRLKKEKVFQCLNDASDYSEIFSESKEKKGIGKDGGIGKCIDTSVAQKTNVDIIHSKLHYEMYKDENEFNDDILLLFENSINIIESEKNKKEKINLYNMRKNALKHYQSEFYKLIISIRGTKEAKHILTSFNNYYEKDEKYFSKLFENIDDTKNDKRGSKVGEEISINNETDVTNNVNISENVKVKEKNSADLTKDDSNKNKKKSSVFRIKLKLDNIKIDELNSVETDRKASTYLTLEQREKESIHTDKVETKRETKHDGEHSQDDESGNNKNASSSFVTKKTVNNEVNKQITNQWENLIKNNILKVLKNDSNSIYFKIPVLYDKNISDRIKEEYKIKIAKPMDYTTVTNNLTNGIYKEPNEVYNDIKLIFKNCLDFNPDISQNKYIIDAAKGSDEKFEELWNKWKDKIYDSYNDSRNKIFSMNNYIEYFKKKKIKKKKYATIYSIWMNYLINNKVDIVEFCKLRNIDIHKLNEKSMPPIYIDNVNLKNFKHMNKNNLFFFIFKEEYKNIYGNTPSNHFTKDGDDQKEQNNEYPDKGEDKLKWENGSKKIKISLKSNIIEKRKSFDEIKKTKYIYPKIFKTWKKRYSNVIYFGENIFDNYLENKKSCMIKCDDNTFLTNCFHFKNVLENLEDFISTPQVGGEAPKSDDQVEKVTNEVEKRTDEGSTGELNGGADLANAQHDKGNGERNKREFEEHGCLSISLKRKKSNEMHMPICSEFQADSDWADSDDEQGDEVQAFSNPMDGVKNDEVSEISSPMDERTLFNIDSANFYNFHGLFDNVPNLNKEMLIKNIKKEKTILISLNLNYSKIEDSSYSPVNNTYFYNYYFDNDFYFFIKSDYKLNMYIKIKRKYIYINNENYIEHLKIYLINKCKQNNQIKLYISNNSITKNGNNFVDFLKKCFTDLHTQNFSNNAMRIHDSANKVSELISRVQTYVKNIDALLKVDKDDETNITTITILRKKPKL
ncbi:bromodomain protein, putative [Plasmodium chabaudi chabaudi]|uniref:Bromodomain protein, putative n=1 Tax=Plasmodium chabaudi chabaudi TaxID=31271 RepID=A0A1C6X200_PLACU|nr:bromodomain protein, putative [Plasmodium chabaudi chabaudi]